MSFETRAMRDMHVQYIHNTATVPKIFCPAFQKLVVFEARLKPRIVSSVNLM